MTDPWLKDTLEMCETQKHLVDVSVSRVELMKRLTELDRRRIEDASTEDIASAIGKMSAMELAAGALRGAESVNEAVALFRIWQADARNAYEKVWSEAKARWKAEREANEDSDRA